MADIRLSPDNKQDPPSRSLVRFAIAAEPTDEPVTLVVRGAPVRVSLSGDRGDSVRSGHVVEATVHDTNGKLVERVCVSHGQATIHVWLHKQYAVALEGVYVHLVT